MHHLVYIWNKTLCLWTDLVLFRKGSTGRSREEIWEALYPLLPDRWQTGRYDISHQDLSQHNQFSTAKRFRSKQTV